MRRAGVTRPMDVVVLLLTWVLLYGPFGAVMYAVTTFLFAFSGGQSRMTPIVGAGPWLAGNGALLVGGAVLAATRSLPRALGRSSGPSWSPGRWPSSSTGWRPTGSGTSRPGSAPDRGRRCGWCRSSLRGASEVVPAGCITVPGVSLCRAATEVRPPPATRARIALIVSCETPYAAAS